MQDKSQGVIKVRRPNQFRLEYTKPYRQLYVADGKQLWSYDEDLEQVIVKPQEGLLNNTPAMILSNPERLDRDYIVSSQGIEANLDWFELKPKREDAHFEAINLAFDQQQLRIMELQDSFGQTTRLEFDEIDRGAYLDSSDFRFTPPAGIDVISQ